MVSPDNEVLAALTASAAMGIRIALPFLTLELMGRESLWLGIPMLAAIHPSIRLAILCSWSLLELLASKYFLSQRLLQIFMLVTSPIAGAIAATSGVDSLPIWLIGTLGGLFAFLLQSVQTAWFYRQPRLQIAFVFAQDIGSILLASLAIELPQLGSIIALFLFLRAMYSYKNSAKWYSKQKPRDR